ncbi:MAG: sulfotransferase [Alicyclobacillaceae bacterium]|nr:sulfotransferase [Alicyclobacillaceae bacterium]
MFATKPNFLIVGAAKSGTTSLDRYLDQHPEIYMAPRKETHYFAAPEMPEKFEGPGDEAFTANLIRDEAEYAAMFERVNQEKAIGESSVYYLYYPGCAERIARQVDVKIIMVLRNPVERAYSAYMHLVRDGRETLDFAEALQQEAERNRKRYQPLWLYREVGQYAEQVERYLHVFGERNVKIVSYDEFNRETQRVLRDIFSFLGVDPDVKVDTSVRYNATGVPIGGLYDIATQSNWLTRLLKPLVPSSVRTKLRLKAKNMTMQRKPLDDEIRQWLRSQFQEEVRHLHEVVRRPVFKWR